MGSILALRVTMKAQILILILILSFSILGMNALFHPNLFSAHDIWHQVARLYWYKTSIDSGVFPPGWIMTLSNGFGYPLFLFSYHLPWIMAIPFLYNGISIENTLKLLFFLSFFFSGAGMYVLTHMVTKNRWSSFTAAIIYLWVPYHFLVILVSAAMGKAFVFTFIPFLILGVVYMAKNTTAKRGALIAAFSLSALILTHLMSLFSLLPLLFLVIALRPQFKWVLLSGVLGIGISAFYLIPAIAYSPLTQIKGGAISDLYKVNFIHFSQLLYSRWGYGIINESAKEGSISFQLGVPQWIGFFAGFILALRKHTLSIALFISTLLSIAMMTDISRPVWNALSQFVTLDYPTMFLPTAVFSTSLLVGVFLSKLPKSIVPVISFALIAIALLNNRNHLRVNMYTAIPLSTYISSEVTTNSYAEYLPANANPKLFETPVDQLVFPNAPVRNVYKGMNMLSFEFENEKDQNVSFRQFAFPGIKLSVDGNASDYKTDEEGRILAFVKKGSHTVTIVPQPTGLMQVSRVASAVSVTCAIGLLLYRRKST